MSLKLFTAAKMLVFFAFLGVNFVAAQDGIKAMSSAGGYKSSLTENQRLEFIQRLQVQELPPAKTAEQTLLLGQTRQQVLQARARQRQESSTKAIAKIKPGSAYSQTAIDGLSSLTQVHHSFNIYSAYSQLITDVDLDGYFQTFSVTFDADILSPIANEEALVYADLYLSQNGGPWLHYFSTDDFIIYGESSDDVFEVYTTLNNGYEPDHYDILIDLYEVGFADIVATYSADDTNTLYGLPLESSDYDPDYVEHEHHHDDHGGAIVSLFWLMIFSFYRLVLPAKNIVS